MKYGILLSITILLVVAGCLPAEKNIEILSAKKDSYEVYLYTKSEPSNKAQNYISALLDWKTATKDQLQMEFQQTKVSLDNIHLKEEQLPALIIKKEGKMVSQITGEQPSRDIFSTIDRSITMASK
ncbi:hypothetical protein [Halobacillus yeomjeoni]|uniref:Uncharacterized protein n=1 Tax=Halobacillus yeomjeoni TaxID=311194 RepID=A0A931HTJ3_9BACI|nr:hypothetical protein [Halobacillus yeomjeoni]MBH0228986.1 hypothetical protein [Halobacillus yeomjeoni]